MWAQMVKKGSRVEMVKLVEREPVVKFQSSLRKGNKYVPGWLLMTTSRFFHVFLSAGT